MIRTQDLIKYLQVDVWLMANSHQEKEYLAETMKRLRERDELLKKKKYYAGIIQDTRE